MLKAILRAAVLAALACAATTAAAQAYPAKPIRFIVPFPAGGGADLWARVISGKLGEMWGQTFVIDNRPGASGIIGAELGAKAPPDGHTLILGTTGSHSTNAVMFKKLPYDPLKDFSPVTNFVDTPFMLVVHPSVPATTVAQLVRIAKARPRELTFASFGTGSSAHFVGELFKTVAKVDLLHVPYKGGPPALNDLVGGHVATMFNSLPAVVPQVQAGRLRGLAVASPRRAKGAPDVPTFAEAGFPGVEGGSWYGVLVPARTPEAIVAKLHADISGLLKLPDIEKRMAMEGGDPIGNTPQQFAEQIRADIAKYTKVAQDAGLKPE